MEAFNTSLSRYCSATTYALMPTLGEKKVVLVGLLNNIHSISDPEFNESLITRIQQLQINELSDADTQLWNTFRNTALTLIENENPGQSAALSLRMGHIQTWLSKELDISQNLIQELDGIAGLKRGKASFLVQQEVASEEDIANRQ